jgi:hypothetical protein
MSITKEQLRSLIREQMSNVSEVADEYTPMMPPKPVDPEGIAGTDVPVTSLSDGFDAAREAVEAMYSPTDRRYISAMAFINNKAETQDQEKTQDKEQTDDSATAPDRNAETWDFLTRSMPDQYKKEENPFRVTKEHLQRIIKEELLVVIEGRSPADQSARKAALAAKIDVSKYPRKQGRDDGADGKERRYPEGKVVEYDEGYEEGVEIKLALDTAFGR